MLENKIKSQIIKKNLAYNLNIYSKNMNKELEIN